MAQATYQLRLKSKAGAQLAVFTQSNLLSLRVQRKINDVATHELSIDATADTRCTLFEVDGQVELWRRPAGGAWYLEYEGFHRTAHWTQDADGREVFTSSGVGYADLLRRRIIAEAARSAGNSSVAWAYLPNTTHEFLQWPYRNPDFDPMDPMRVVDGLLDTVEGWLVRTLGAEMPR